MSFRAFVVDKDDDDFSASVQTLDDSSLPDGDVTVAVEWSDLNYKDGLACTPNGRVVFKYPMTIGIDFAGTVLESSDSRYSEGDSVVATGYDLGTAHAGGYAERVRVPADWLAPLPEGMTWAGQVAAQLQSVLLTAVFAPLVTIVLLFLLRAVFGDLRVSEEAEFEGLDVAEHSESAYVE